MKLFKISLSVFLAAVILTGSLLFAGAGGGSSKIDFCEHICEKKLRHMPVSPAYYVEMSKCIRNCMDTIHYGN